MNKTTDFSRRNKLPMDHKNHFQQIGRAGRYPNFLKKDLSDVVRRQLQIQKKSKKKLTTWPKKKI